MNPLQQQIKIILHEQLSRDEKMVSKIHLLPNITIKGIMEYLSVDYEKAKELLDAFIIYIEQGHVTHIRGNMDLNNKPIKSLGNLQSVGGYLYLVGTPLTSLGHLQSVGGDLELLHTSITSLGNLQTVGRDLYLKNTKITSLGSLKSVGGYLVLIGTSITSLGNLQTVGNKLHISKKSIPKSELVKIQVGGEIIYH